MNAYSRRYRMSLHGQPWYDQWRARQRRRQQHQQRRPYQFHAAQQIRLDAIVAPENLLCALEELERKGGAAPGPDGVTFKQLSKRRRWELCRFASQLLKERRYKPGPTKQVRIAKTHGGYRTLTIRNLIDRVISKALTTALTPFLSAMMLDCSFGSRPNKNVHQLIAELSVNILRDERLWIVTDDVRKAFDFVPISILLEIYTQLIHDEDVLHLIQTVLQGQKGEERERGIDQGDPLSPISLNVLLDSVLDKPL